MEMHNVTISATASVLPPIALTNFELVQRLIDGARNRGSVDPVAEERALERAALIEKKTGLRSRRFFSSTDNPVDVGASILERLMDGQDWAALDAIIVSSSSTHGFPGLSQQIVAASREQNERLGHPFILDIGSNACAGFTYAFTIGQSLIQAMNYKKVALIAIEFSSRCISYDPNAFGISTLFGDAAAGVLLSSERSGIASIVESRATSLVDNQTLSYVKGSGMSAHDQTVEVPQESRWFMAGPPVAIGAINILTDEIRRYQAQGYAIDWLIPHQANLKRILFPSCEATGIDISKLCTSFEETGNTSSASIPLLLDQLIRDTKPKSGDNALLVGFGASFSIGSALICFQ
jgi:3-oxoacyl-[acyl-carrier-protein] synthase-3